MLTNKQLIYRIATAKLIGLFIGIGACLITLQLDLPVSTGQLWGLFLWYPTVGAIIGIMGVIDHHPILNVRIPWWFRGPFMGAWMNLLIGLFAGDLMLAFTNEAGLPGAGIHLAVFWFVLEGLFVGGLMDFAGTAIALMAADSKSAPPKI